MSTAPTCTDRETGERTADDKDSQSHECELWLEGDTGSSLWNKCNKHPGHTNFIRVRDFSLHHLPEPYRGEAILKLVNLLSALTVRVKVKFVSPNRPDGYVYWMVRGQFMTHTGSGFVCSCDVHESANTPCPCTSCINTSVGERPARWWSVWVRTAKHVIFDDKEALHTTVDVGYDDDEEEEKKKEEVDNVSRRYDDEEDEKKEEVDKLSSGEKAGNPKAEKHVKPGMHADTDLTVGEDHIKVKDKTSGAIKDKKIDHKDLESPASEMNADKACISKDKNEKVDNETPQLSEQLQSAAIHDGTSDESPMISNKSGISKEAVGGEYKKKKLNESSNVSGQLQGIRIRGGSVEEDWCQVECVTHDKDLGGTLGKLCDDFSQLRNKLNQIDHSGMDYPPLALISSHPHGFAKRITVGEWKHRGVRDAESLKDYGVESTDYTYSTPTCRGSSGAPVLVLGQSMTKSWVYGPMWYHPHSGAYLGGLGKSAVGYDMIHGND